MKTNGERHYLWRAVDHEGEVLESYVSKRQDRKAALKFVSIHASIQNHFNQERHLYSRTNFKLNRAAALAELCHLLSA